jgi:4-aminobutyrate aminotransferase
MSIERSAIPGSTARALVQRDERVIAPSAGRVYPLVIDRAAGCEVWDVDGHRYLDMMAGIAVVAAGHSHPRLVQAMQEQLTRWTHIAGSDFYSAEQVRLAEKVVSLMPDSSEWQLFLTNSGTEAVEASIKLARYATGRQNIIAFYGAFHGRSYGSVSLTASKYLQRQGYFPLLPGVAHTHFPYCYRCPINLNYPACNIACLDMIEHTLFQTTMPAADVAAIIVEPIQGEGGYIVPPAGTLKKLRAICDRHGILLILDEVQSGTGRTGKLWAFEHEEIVPDIVAAAKGFGGGMPIGALIARAELTREWKPGAHGNTYGGNALACVSAYETLCLVEEELCANAARMGSYLLNRLQTIQQRIPQIGNVRGRGLMVGVECINPETGEPAGTLAKPVMEEAFRRGLLLLTCGASTVRFCPPLIITQAEIDEGLAIFEATMQACVT